MRGRILISEDYDPAYNLAIEEYLIEKKESVLYLWQNDNTIVIGRNQNPYKECDVKKINEDGVNLVRRKSGGGAVFHDLGNLNFTIISPKNKNNIIENFKFINKTLSTLGIDSVFNGRNDVHVMGKKISGNAFYEKDNIFCHHGTLLIDVDTNKLSRYLTASKLKLDSKGIKSVKSRVLNLIDVNPNINVNIINNAFINMYKQLYNVCDIEYIKISDVKNNSKIMDKVKLYKSWDWTYGQSPKSNLVLEEKFSWGIIDFNLYIESGKITECNIYTDSILNDNFKKLEDSLLGKEFKKQSFIYSIQNYMENEKIKEDLSNYIISLSIV